MILRYRNQDVIHRFEDILKLTPEEAETLFEDVLLFICIRAEQIRLGQQNRVSPPDQIDKGWHEFLMFTREYARFCDGYFAEMIHHIPFTREERALGTFPPIEKTIEWAQKLMPGRRLSKNWDIPAVEVLESNPSPRYCVRV